MRAMAANDPMEVALWREIIEYRDHLVAVVAREDTAVNLTLRLPQRAARRQEIDQTTAREVEAELVAEVHAEARAAKAALKSLDRRLGKRTKRSPPPRTLVEDLRRELLADAVRAVKLYMADSTDLSRDRAQAILDYVGRRLGGPTTTQRSLDDLLNAARQWRKERNRGGGAVAQYVVATVAKLPPETKLS